MKFLLQSKSSGWYVSAPGQSGLHTSLPELAWAFTGREAAKMQRVFGSDYTVRRADKAQEITA